MASTILPTGFLTQALTYGFRIGNNQIPGRPDIESLIQQGSAPLLIDPAALARSLKTLRGTSSSPALPPLILTGGPERFTRLLFPSDGQKLSPPNDQDEELGLVGPFRDQGLDRPLRLQELKNTFRSFSHPIDERIDAIEQFTNLAAVDDTEQNIQALLKLVEEPEAGLSFSVFQALSAEWRLHNHVRISLLWMHGLAAIFHLSRRGEIEDHDRKTILDFVIRICLNHPWGIALVRLEEDPPADDPHRVAPYVIDLDRPQRLLLGELINQLTEGLGYDPRSHEDHERYNRISHARQILQANELAVQKYLKEYDPKPDRPARFAWLRNLLIPSSRKNHRGKRLAAVLQQYRDLFRRLPGRTETLFRHYPFAYNTSSTRKRLP
ncbi:MAG TPA: hypothetical protein VLJ37_06485 [bacterium]|nr:hypothetical protein [bacterium]